MSLKRVWWAIAVLSLGAGFEAIGADTRPLSPGGSSVTQVGGKWTAEGERRHYDGGKWIEVTYGRPLLRGRPGIFGTGADYGKAVNAGAPVWRLGANQTTKLKTEVALNLGGKKLAAGEYDLFADLKESGWTLIVSTQPAAEKYDPNDKSKLWGSYGYDPKFNVAQVPMKMSQHPTSVDELTITFEDVTDKGGTLAIDWDKTHAEVPFTVE
jgi:hypothetical protein